MRTVRRLYFYLVAFISLEVIIWGTILLARTLFATLPGGGDANLLAGGLSLVLVGLPIFLLHWSIVQREALRDAGERGTRLRALFLYGARLAVLLPVAQNVLAILNRAALELLRTPASQALVGSQQTLPDNLAAIALNLAAWAYLERVLRSDLEAGSKNNYLGETRRLYRYVWVLYGLFLGVSGVQQVLRYIFYTPPGAGDPPTSWLANGIALALVGALAWAWNWRLIQANLDEREERSSPLHLVITYLATLLAAILFVISASGFAAALLQWALAPGPSLGNLAGRGATALSLAIPVAAVWAYYGRERRQAVRSVPEDAHRAELERLYGSILALAGNVATFAGLWILVDALAGLALAPLGDGQIVLARVGRGIGTLLVGAPIWLVSWNRLQAEALPMTPAGDAARRSLVRRAYLYLALFLTVVGSMAAAVTLLYLLFTSLLSSAPTGLRNDLLRRVLELALVLVWLGYHWTVLRQDQRRTHKALGERFARFPVLIVQADDHPFAGQLVEALQREAPGLPAAVHRLDLAQMSEELMEARAVVLPAGLAFRQPEALRLWLNEFSGERVVTPLPAGGLVFAGNSPQNEAELVQQTALAVRALAEGRTVQARTPLSAWSIAGYVLGGVFLLLILLLLLSAGVNLLAG